MKKFLSKYAFWVIQILGWSMFWGWNLYSSEYERTLGESIYYLFSWLVECIVATSSLRWLLKKAKFDISNITFLNVLKLLAAFSVVNLFFMGLQRLMMYFRLFFFEPFSEESGPEFITRFIYFGIILGGWAACYLIFILYRKLNRQRIERLQISSDLKQAHLNVLRGQINPNFLIESLNSVKELSFKDVFKARELLTQLSDLLRYSLTKNDVNTVRLDQEISMIECYVDLVNIEHENHLQIKKKLLVEDILTTVPPMMMVKLLEVIYRSLATSLGVNRKIDIQTSKIKEEISLCFRISCSRMELHLIENGLTETRQRFKLFYGLKGDFSTQFENEQLSIDMLMPIDSNLKP